MGSAFEKIKKEVINLVQKTETIIELENQLKFILDEWDFTEEWKR